MHVADAVKLALGLLLLGPVTHRVAHNRHGTEVLGRGVEGGSALDPRARPRLTSTLAAAATAFNVEATVNC